MHPVEWKFREASPGSGYFLELSASHQSKFLPNITINRELQPSTEAEDDFWLKYLPLFRSDTLKSSVIYLITSVRLGEFSCLS